MCMPNSEIVIKMVKPSCWEVLCLSNKERTPSATKSHYTNGRYVIFNQNASSGDVSNTPWSYFQRAIENRVGEVVWVGGPKGLYPSAVPDPDAD
jgi:hypothetical protein